MIAFLDSLVEEVVVGWNVSEYGVSERNWGDFTADGGRGNAESHLVIVTRSTFS